MVRRLCVAALALLLFGCASRHPTDRLGVKPQHLTPEEWSSISQPGDSHKLLDAFVGDWTVDVVSWRDPKANPERSKAHSSSTWVLGFRYVREKFRSLELGPRYEGLGFIGYDAGAKLFTSVWMDSLNTSIATSQGLFNPTTSTLEFRGEIYDPLLGKTKETKTFIRVLSADTYEISMIDRTARGEEFTSLQMTYRRARGGERKPSVTGRPTQAPTNKSSADSGPVASIPGLPS